MEENVETKAEEHVKSDPKQEALKPLCLKILKVIKDAQQQHGLRHGDYQRYRGYCSRRIRRLRKVLKLPQGDRRHFKRRDVTEVHIALSKADERFLHLPLMQAERSWAYAMQLRQEANTEPRKKFHLISKLRKACVYALKLEELCKLERCDARSKLEAQAYVAWIHGILQFELQLWNTAAENLKKAQVVYEKLCGALEEEEQIAYRQRVDEIAPTLRYCAYNVGEDKSIDITELRGQGLLENLDILMAQAKEKQADVLYEVEWHGLKINVRSEKIRLFLVSIEDLDERLKKADDTQERIKILDQTLVDCRDAISVAREDKVANQLLLSYLLGIRLRRTIERNIYLVEQARKHQDKVRLFDIILQQIGELQQLPGVEEITSYQAEWPSQIAAYKGFRCFHMARALTNTKRWKEGVGLYNRALQHAKTALSGKLPSDLHGRLISLQDDVEKEMLESRAQFVLEQEAETVPAPIIPVKTSTKNKKPLIDRLDEYHEDPQFLSKNPNIVSIPPPMEPVAAKPFFYDIALNHVEFPEYPDPKTKKTQESKPSGAPGTSSGISGFVKGLWGWGK